MNQNFKRAHSLANVADFRAPEHQMHDDPNGVYVWLCVNFQLIRTYILFRWPINIIYSEWHRIHPTSWCRYFHVIHSSCKYNFEFINFYTDLFLSVAFAYNVNEDIGFAAISNSAHEMEKWGLFIAMTGVRKTRKFQNKNNILWHKVHEKWELKTQCVFCYYLWNVRRNWLNEFRVRCLDHAEYIYIYAIQSERMKSSSFFVHFHWNDHERFRNTVIAPI